MSSLDDESIELPSNFSGKHPRSDNVNALLPHSKKLRIADEKTAIPYITPIDHDTRGFFCAIKRLPGEMRNEIYDAVLALMRLSSTAPLIQANKCAIRTGRKAKGDSEGRSQRECRQLLLRDIENCALRLVPGLRAEFMSRLWNWVNIRFCSFDVECPPFEHDYSFLRAARVAKITYQAHRDHYYIRDSDDTFLWAKPFVQALEQMEFYGTVKLTGWKGKSLHVGVELE
ncbi:uncharacterized protein LTHEOB_7014 [Neofusicoccum parvum]|uniref:Uncharacterized protein LTHEOB_7014 n=1 Tax=Neofusicoccum parvum TaxID=310453 RepID=A0ACB5RT11_9PEZI|nr:uncharacterized protein LTHEOB_7014 [Neofusicoccum parvum]